jgi:hypothetical protein
MLFLDPKVSDDDVCHSRVTGFWGFVHRPVFKKLKNTTLLKLGMFPSSGDGGGGEDTYSVGSLRRS